MTHDAAPTAIDPRATLTRTLGSMRPLVTMERDGLVLIALHGTTSGDPGYLTFEAASSANAVDVHEPARVRASSRSAQAADGAPPLVDLHIRH